MITDKGYIVPTIEEIYLEKLNDFKSVKPDLRETDSNILIAWLRFDSVEEYDDHLHALSAYSQLSAYTATGSGLNAITSHLNMTWEKPKKSVGKVTIVGDVGTVIPQAWGVGTKSGIKFVTMNSESIVMTSKEIELDVIALNGGKDGNVGIGNISEQTEIITGVKTISNKNFTYGGKDLETDTELRERYFKRIDRKSSFTTEGIKNYILQNTNAKKCQVIENETDLTDADGRLPHSYEAICLGDTNENILKALYDYKLAGIRSVGDIQKSFGDIAVGFSRPIERKIFFNVKIEGIKDVWKKEYEEVIKSTLYEAVDKVEPQGTIHLYSLIGEIYKKTAGIVKLSIKMGDSATSAMEKDYSLKRKEIAVISNDSVVIEVVVI